MFVGSYRLTPEQRRVPPKLAIPPQARVGQLAELDG